MNIIQKYWRIADIATKIFTPILTIGICIGLITLLGGPNPEDSFLIVTGALFSLTLMENMWTENLRRARILTYDQERAEHYFTPKEPMDISPTILNSFRKYAATGKASKEALSDFRKYGLIQQDEYDSPVTTPKGDYLLNSH